MEDTNEKVSGLQQLLAIKMKDVEVEIEKTNELMEIVGRESTDAQREADAAAIQEADTIDATNKAKAEKASAQTELDEAVPAMERAQAAVDCLTVKAI
jgi:hypothetical protein